MMEFCCVAALDQERGIGANGQLPWKLKGDMQYFRNLTTAVLSPDQKNAVVMGRLTWESIPEKYRPLPERLNLVLTTREDWEPGHPDVLSASSLDEALATLEARSDVGQVFVIGGGRVYHDAIAHPQCVQLFLTHVDAMFDCDTFFPPYDHEYVAEAASETQEENGIQFCLAVYSRKT
jgi:dihydrofolate reductase